MINPKDFEATSSRHKMSRTAEYRAWGAMKSRCNNPKIKNYHNYGGRGIKVCNRWNKSFLAFYEDMGTRPDKHSIDRINNDGDYEPSNCRWATAKEQLNNSRINRVIEYDGKKQTLQQWAEELKIPKQTLEARLRNGWTVKQAIESRNLRKRFNHAKAVELIQQGLGDKEIAEIIGTTTSGVFKFRKRNNIKHGREYV